QIAIAKVRIEDPYWGSCVESGKCRMRGWGREGKVDMQLSTLLNFTYNMSVSGHVMCFRFGTNDEGALISSHLPMIFSTAKCTEFSSSLYGVHAHHVVQ